MTREDAIKMFEYIRHTGNGESEYKNDAQAIAIDMAIKALEQEPCDDVISRAEAEAIFRNARSKLNPSDYKTADEFNTRDLMLLNAKQLIHLLPSVKPQERTGYWIEHPEIKTSTPEYLMFYECSECGDKQCFCKSDIQKKHFCNNCGAKMSENPTGSESEDKE